MSYETTERTWSIGICEISHDNHMIAIDRKRADFSNILLGLLGHDSLTRTRAKCTSIWNDYAL